MLDNLLLTETDPINGDAKIYEAYQRGDTMVHTVELEAICHELHGHDHTIDHVLRVVSGKINLWVCKQNEARTMDGVPRTLRAGEECLVPAGDWHTYKALEPSVCECIFPIRNADGELVAEVKQQYLAGGGV